MENEEIIDREVLKKIEELIKKIDPSAKVFNNSRKLILQLKENNDNNEETDKTLIE